MILFIRYPSWQEKLDLAKRIIAAFPHLEKTRVSPDAPEEVSLFNINITIAEADADISNLIYRMTLLVWLHFVLILEKICFLNHCL